MALVEEWTAPSADRLDYPPDSIGAEVFAWLDKGFAIATANGMGEEEAVTSIKIAALL